MLEAVEASMFRKHAAPKQKAEANEGEGGGGCGRVRAVTDRLTLQPPDPDITTSHLGAPGSNKPWPATVRPTNKPRGDARRLLGG